MESKVAPYFDRVILNDAHPYLIACLRAVQQGWTPPDVVTEEQYKYIKEHKDENPALTGFVGFACAFGGRWFASYARGGHGADASTGRRSLLRKMETLMDAEILCGDYRDVVIPEGAVVYADPPYAGVRGYCADGGRHIVKFDTEAFWAYMREISREGRRVYISEMTAPSDFRCIWEKDILRCANAQKQIRTTERLFVYDGN